MEVRKTAGEVAPGVETAEMGLINRLSRRELEPDEVYTFAVRLCDNEIDRDFERFDRASLERLGELFLGKSGIFDHQWTARGQSARLYRTAICTEEGVAAETNEGRCCLKGWAYMLRCEANRDLIAEIEAGIKKEVSVGCAVRRRVCSICGKETGECGHVPGQRYDGKLCYATLQEPTDAYEWSFVAVPAQRKAGVVKALQDAAAERGLSDAWEEMSRQAALGRRYLEELRGEVVRLMGQAEGDMERSLLVKVADRLELEELLELRKVYRGRVALSVSPQLSGKPGEDGDGQAFLV